MIHGKRYLECATSGTAALVKVIGICDMHLAPTLDDLTIMLEKEGTKNLAIDFKECMGMDSTFMGTLISINVRFSDEGWMCLINVSEENRDLLKMLGVWGMLPVKESFEIDPVKTVRLKPSEEDITDKRMLLIKKAHEKLVAISEANEERFGPFLASLKEQIDSEIDSEFDQ